MEINRLKSRYSGRCRFLLITPKVKSFIVILECVNYIYKDNI